MKKTNFPYNRNRRIRNGARDPHCARFDFSVYVGYAYWVFCPISAVRRAFGMPQVDVFGNDFPPRPYLIQEC